MYSWSKINMFDSAEKGEGCFYAYYLQYIERIDDRKGNFFSELGEIVHNLQQKIINEKIIDWDIEDELNKAIEEMEYKAPFKPQRSYFEPLRNYFVNDGFKEQMSEYKVVGIEDWAQINIKGIPMIVKPDFLAEHKEKGLVLADIKISKPYVGENLKNKLRQLYVYSKYVKDLYDMFPHNLLFIFPREPLGKREYFFQFSEREFEESEAFVVNTVEKIEMHTDWKPRCEELDDPDDDFYARELCSYRHICPVKCNKVKSKYEDDDIFFEWFE